MIDATDRQILEILQQNSRTSNADIARAVGMAASATLERIRKLEERGVIRGYRVDLEPRGLGLGILAFIFIKADESLAEAPTAEALAAIPAVLEIHHVAGEDCYLAKVRAESTDALGRMLREVFGAIPTITSTRTTIVLETVKEGAPLPLAGGLSDD